MKLGLQMGHGMQSLATEFLGNQRTGNDIILSPRNFRSTASKSSVERIVAYANGNLGKGRGRLMLDPQLFVPEGAAGGLSEFPYWQKCMGNLNGNISETMASLCELNESCGTDVIITPSAMCETVNDAWLESQAEIVKRVHSISSDKPVWATVALGASALKEEHSVDEVLFGIERWGVDGVYVVAEHPGNSYLVDQPLWLYSLMSLVAGCKRIGKEVGVGYASHQMLAMALAGCDRLFSGNYLNVRRFERQTFEGGDKAIQQTSLWYYAPQALSEFKLTTLDLAQRQNVLKFLESPYGDDRYAGMLFSGALPSETAYNDRCSFMHYLISINQQCAQLSRGSYEETRVTMGRLLSTAESLVDGLREKGIHDKGRNFAGALPATLQAVAAFDSSWGFQMEHEWSRFSGDPA